MIWIFLMRIYGDFSFWRFVHRDFSLKIYFGDFSTEILKFLRRFVHGDFSFGIWFWRFFLWKMEIFPFEDLFVEIFPWRFILEIFPLNFWKFLRRFVHGDFSFGIWFWRFFLLKICSWRFFLEDLFLEIFPLKFWKFLLKICSLEIFFMIIKWRRWRFIHEARMIDDFFFFKKKNLDFEWE